MTLHPCTFPHVLSHAQKQREEPNGDAELIELGACWERAEADYRDACERLGAAEEAARHPNLPEALLAQYGDESFGFGRFVVTTFDGRHWYPLHVSDGPANQFLRRVQTRAHTRPVRPEDNLPADAEAVTMSVPWPEAQARADAIVHAWDAWRAAVNAADIEAGVPDAEARVNRLSVVLCDLQERIETATAHTLAGLKVKARYAHSVDGEGSMIPDALVTGIIRDLLALDG